MSKPSNIIAVDTGGTFTDVVGLIDGALRIVKVPSTPSDPAQAVIDGIHRLLDDAPSSTPRTTRHSPLSTPFVLIHGSTVATNALLERKGATVALITNRGFEDVLEIGRQTRPQLYALSGHRKPPLIPRARRHGIAGRLGPRGEQLEAIDANDHESLEAVLAGADSVAVCLLHSYANAEHEDAVGAALARFSLPVSLSHDILAEYREYERCSTTVVNAYVAPLMGRYLERLEHDSGASRVRIMGSGGGALPVGVARRQPVHTVLSGPAGGVAGAMAAARAASVDRIVTFDMGGTSTDVSICPGRILHTRELTIDQIPVAIPVIDIHTVGAGGGSLAWIDAGGALRVGPQSAGAEPGPICYGRGGTEITVTDAQVWLNRLPSDAFLGGTSALHRDRIGAPLKALAKRLGKTADQAAEGVIDVVNTAMESALRVITVERGYDPVDFTLVAFGGAAGLHAVELAVRLGIPRILLPTDPGLLSAHGMLVSPIRKDAARTVLVASNSQSIKEFRNYFRELEKDVMAAMSEDEVRKSDVTLVRSIDARYRGQSFELRVPAEEWVEEFHRAHQRRYGYAQPDAVVEAVTLRVVGTARLVALPARRRTGRGAGSGERGGGSRVVVGWNGGKVDAKRYERPALAHGQRVKGPAVIAEYSSTTWLPPGWTAVVDRLGNLMVGRK